MTRDPFSERKILAIAAFYPADRAVAIAGIMATALAGAVSHARRLPKDRQQGYSLAPVIQRSQWTGFFPPRLQAHGYGIMFAEAWQSG